MMEEIKKEQIRMYAEELLYPEVVESLSFYKTVCDEEGDTDVWLLESDTGNVYWVMEGVYPANIIRKSGIYEDVSRAYEAYVDMAKEVDLTDVVADRFHQWEV